ncbi:hypothetical protein MRB53_027553 [Persea americana]|uniref:Uncharacterized protein n=1 Tax=Persea americana TaxID=3435 RepID=A0ACC2LM97_PERAE|nr:hypothetical protein MRB53_027553 [Persea americana]
MEEREVDSESSVHRIKQLEHEENTCSARPPGHNAHSVWLAVDKEIRERVRERRREFAPPGLPTTKDH